MASVEGGAAPPAVPVDPTQDTITNRNFTAPDHERVCKYFLKYYVLILFFFIFFFYFFFFIFILFFFFFGFFRLLSPLNRARHQ